MEKEILVITIKRKSNQSDYGFDIYTQQIEIESNDIEEKVKAIIAEINKKVA